jgi:lysozyme family protein
VIGVIHYREADMNFGAQLAQGDPLGQVSTHVPSGRGPFFNHPSDPAGQDAFYRGALDALIDCAPQSAKWTDWSAGGTCTLMEEYNGLGYAMRGIPSAYVWSGTDQYVKGKFVRDGVFDANVVDAQDGCAAILRCLMDIESIKFGQPKVLAPQPTSTTPPIPKAAPAPGPDVATPEPLWKLLLQEIQTSSQNVTITPTKVQEIIRQIQAFSPVINAEFGRTAPPVRPHRTPYAIRRPCYACLGPSSLNRLHPLGRAAQMSAKTMSASNFWGKRPNSTWSWRAACREGMNSESPEHPLGSPRRSCIPKVGANPPAIRFRADVYFGASWVHTFTTTCMHLPRMPRPAAAAAYTGS